MTSGGVQASAWLLRERPTRARLDVHLHEGAVPLDAKSAILDAFRLHQLVAIGDAHGNEQGEAFQLALVQDPRFPQIVNDIQVKRECVQ